MLIRRFGQNRRNLGIATLAIAFLFCVYLYYDLLNQLKQNDERNQRLKALQNSLSTQLQVVYEHKTRLEKAIQDEKDHHHKTKEAKQDLEMKYNREKQELQNRYQSVNQKQRILQTQFEDLQKELSKSETDYQLLKSDYQREVEEYKEKIFTQSQQCNKEKKYLNEEINDMKLSQKEISESFAQCQDALKLLQLQIDDQKNKPVLHNSADNVNKPLLRVSRSIDPYMHINTNSSAQVTAAADMEGKRKTFIGKEENDNNEKQVLAFQPDNIMNNLVHVQDNRMQKQQEEDQHQLQAAPPPHGNVQRPQRIQDIDALKGRGQLDRGQVLGANGANAAVIEAPNEPDLDRQPNKDLNEDEDEEEAEEKNGQNEADQKDDDDYQYDKNVDGEEKNDKKDDIPDAMLPNKNLNKIRNPVYPDDVEVFNH